MAASVEIDAVIEALAGCLRHAARTLARREAELLAVLEQDALCVALGGDHVELPLLALCAARRHQIAAIEFATACLFEQVDTATGSRLALRPAPSGHGSTRAHALRIVALAEPARAELHLDGRLLRALSLPEGGDDDDPRARRIPRASLLLLSPGDAAQVTMDPPEPVAPEPVGDSNELVVGIDEDSILIDIDDDEPVASAARARPDEDESILIDIVDDDIVDIELDDEA